MNLGGCFFITSASAAPNTWSTTLVCHLLVDWLIKIATEEFSCPYNTGEVILALFLDGNQLSPHILICFPSPTRQSAPLEITSLPLGILLHAYEAEDESFASRIEPLGKNLALKTL